MDLSQPIEKLRFSGPRNISRLKHLGINTLRNLLWHFPVRYEDYTKFTSIADLQAGEKVSIQGEIVKIDVRRIFPRRLTIIEAIVRDETGGIRATWFNQPFIATSLPEGTMVSLAGKVQLDKRGLYLSSPAFEKMKDELVHTQGLVPIYPETEGVTSKYIRFLIKPLLEKLSVPDPLPETIKEKYQFPELKEALISIHHPSSLEEAEKAKKRLAFDDLLLFQIKALLERRKMNQLKSISISFNQELIQSFISTLPFELTKDQKIAAWEIFKDLEKSYPMNRLLEGDVGSGKTVVALMAALEVAQAGYQAVFMAPTEILAHQHFETISTLTKHLDLDIGLLTSSAASHNRVAVKKAEVKQLIESGHVKILIGTHAVIQKDVKFKNLALVVIDEQHRFGVAQRAALAKHRTDLVPHLLSMTATPIPRTLALTIYGDLDISIIKEKPKNRQKVMTRVIPPSQRGEAYQFIKEEVKKGRQVFVVCPRIEIGEQKENESKAPQKKMSLIWADVKAVEEEYIKLSEEIFPDLKVKMLHGKMKPQEKQEIMHFFKEGWTDILVSTSVIEVGVDIPNATVMAIESAERFGLAQLHQFRGRIGRSEHQSHCLLFTTSSERTINQRLKALVDYDDGFILAEKDLALRGPGEFFGTGQSGLPDLAMASLADVELIKKARLEARILLKEDSHLKKYPLLMERLGEFQKLTHFE